MTDEMRAREDAICKVAGIKDIGDLSDGFHTFNQLYYQRMILFATIVKQNRDLRDNPELWNVRVGWTTFKDTAECKRKDSEHE